MFEVLFAELKPKMEAAEHSEFGSSFEQQPSETQREGARPLPFVREARWQMDNCPGQYKSQYGIGGIALLALLGILDAVGLFFMVVGHTKF